jgi:hypothetical protein
MGMSCSTHGGDKSAYDSVSKECFEESSRTCDNINMVLEEIM